MGRNLVVCLDGTNNRYAATNTNVVALYSMLDKSASDQLAYYQPGIGTFAPPGVWGKTKRWYVTRLDLAVAWLLEDHVTSAYRYLMRYYQPGDQIWIYGFSRGAYSARALAAMLFTVGLLTPGNEELLPFAWDIFERERDIKVYGGFRKTFAREVKVHFLGLWDTVSSVGWVANKFLRFTIHNPIVEVVRHAVALDERRSYFVQNLWADPPLTDQDVQQIWFAGVHSDVGGGYPESECGLAKIALAWMVRESEAAGLRFDLNMKAAILPPADTPQSIAASERAMQHESLHGSWWIAEYLPKHVRDPTRNWAPMWILHRGQHRYLPEGSKIHESVFRRMTELPNYRPPNLPQNYQRAC